MISFSGNSTVSRRIYSVLLAHHSHVLSYNRKLSVLFSVFSSILTVVPLYSRKTIALSEEFHGSEKRPFETIQGFTRLACPFLSIIPSCLCTDKQINIFFETKFYFPRHLQDVIAFSQTPFSYIADFEIKSDSEEIYRSSLAKLREIINLTQLRS